MNLAAYNYLGFAQGKGPCTDAVEESINRYGVSACGSRLEGGTLDLSRLAPDGSGGMTTCGFDPLLAVLARSLYEVCPLSDCEVVSISTAALKL